MDPFIVYKEGGVLVVAVALFLANFVQNYSLKKANESLVCVVKDSNAAQAASNLAVVEHLSEMTLAISEGQKRLTEGLTTLIKNQEILAANQMNLTHSNNEIVRELIGVIRVGERS